MNRKKILRSILYGILGFIFSIGGIIGLLFPSISVPDDLISERELFHTTMELGAAIVPIGFLLIWSAINVEKVAKLDSFFLLFFLLFSSVHWFEFIVGNRHVLSPLINSIPLVLIILAILIRNDIKIK